MTDSKVPIGATPPPSYPGETQPGADVGYGGQPGAGVGYGGQPGAGVGYGGQPNYPGVALSPPQQTVMIVPQHDPNREAEAGAAASMTGAYLSSCLTLWLCGNVLFGFIGFILAIIGSAYIGSNNRLSRQLSTASMIVTWVGFVITAIVIVTVVVIMVQQGENYNWRSFGDAESVLNDGFNDANKVVNDGYNEANKAVNGGLNALNGLFTTTPKPWWG